CSTASCELFSLCDRYWDCLRARAALVAVNGFRHGGALRGEDRAIAYLEAHVRTDEVGDEIHDRRVLRERPELGMLVHGLAQLADVRLLGRVIRRQIELIVRGRQRPRL